MRFRLENGGRAGVRSAADLGGVLQTWVPEKGSLWIDFSPGNDQPGEVFRTVRQLKKETSWKQWWEADGDETPANIAANDARRKADMELAERLWAEGVALEISRATGPATAGRTGQKAL